MVKLTAEERQRFADWLEQDAEAERGLLAEMKKLPGMGLGPLIQRREIEIASGLLVAKKLRSIEDF